MPTRSRSLQFTRSALRDRAVALSRSVGRKGHVMRCEEFEDAGCVVVRAEVPGVDPDEDVEVTVVGGLLRIRVCRRERHPARRARGRSEFFYGEMVRTVALPPGVDDGGVTASYVDGILEIVVPLAASSHRARAVPVAHVGPPPARG